jgi:hypothetical protein
VPENPSQSQVIEKVTAKDRALDFAMITYNWATNNRSEALLVFMMLIIFRMYL